ncbi:AraC family transcriptional regulator [Paenibacillaceae bacterium]|nr:AraC family transcriptional regulator [Paenibacillaceae bacterium]
MSDQELERLVDQDFNRFLTAFPVYCKAKLDDIRMGHMHAHDGYEFHFSYSSGSIRLAEGEQYSLAPGKLAIIKPQTYHYIRPDREAAYRRTILSVEESYLSALLQEESSLAELFQQWFAVQQTGVVQMQIHDKGDAAAVQILLARIEQELSDRRQHFNLMVKAALLELLITLGRQEYTAAPGVELSTAQRAAMDEAAHYMMQHCTANMPIEAVARHFHMSPSYLHRLFKVYAGCTPHQFQMQQRIQLAKSLLIEGDEPITEIALRVGFQELAHFCRTFRKLTGASPGSYRAGQRGRVE